MSTHWDLVAGVVSAYMGVVASTVMAADLPIIGSWTFDSNGCAETYHFDDKGIRTVSANQEIVKAEYVLQPFRVGDGLYLLTDTVVADNGKPDCAGDTSVMTGDTVQLLVRFQHQPERFSFCFDDALEDCVGPFIKTN